MVAGFGGDFLFHPCGERVGAGPEDAGIGGGGQLVEAMEFAGEIFPDLMDGAADAGIDLDVALHEFGFEPILVGPDLFHDIEDGAFEGEGMGIDQL